MFLKHLKNFVPGVCRDRSIEVAVYFRIVASLGVPSGQQLLAKWGAIPRTHRTIEPTVLLDRNVGEASPVGL
jgi:hypothetical protein